MEYDGSGRTGDATTFEIVRAYLDHVADALMAGDFDAYADLIDLPFVITTQMARFLRSTREETRNSFELWQRTIATHQVTRFIQPIQSVDRFGDNAIIAVHDTDLRNGNQRVLPIFTNWIFLRRKDDAWLMEQLISGVSNTNLSKQIEVVPPPLTRPSNLRRPAMPKLDLSKVPVKTGSIYPAPYGDMMTGRSSLRLGQAAGLSQFGVNLTILEPGARSSLRHWHLNEDEFVMVIDGTVTLVDDFGAHAMVPGDCAAFPAGDPNGHCFENRSDAPARFLVIGTKSPSEVATYSDIDLKLTLDAGQARFTRKDGRPYEPEENDG